MLALAVLSPILYSGYTDLQSARSAMANGRNAEAAAHYESAARLLVWRNDLWNQAGLAYYHAGDVENAQPALETARRRGSLSDQGWDSLASILWARGDQAGAISTWQAGSRAAPSYAPLWDHLISAYHATGEYAMEQDALRQRLELGEDAGAHYRLGLLLMLSDPDRARGEFSAAASLDADFDSATQTLITTSNVAALEADPSRRLMIIGRGLGLVDEWGLAEKAFEQAVRDDSKNAEAWAWLGEARQHQDNGNQNSTRPAGSEELDKALALNPRDTVVRALRGLYWKRQGEYRQALNEYIQAAQLEPDNPAWQASAGEIYVQLGDLVSALEAYQKATELAPNDSTYWRLLATFCADNEVQVLEIGLPAAKKAAELAPGDPQVLDALGWAYAQTGYLYNAQQTLNQAIKLAPDLAIAHLHLAENYLKQGNQTAAFEELHRTRDLDSNGAVGQFAAQLLQQYFP